MQHSALLAIETGPNMHTQLAIDGFVTSLSGMHNTLTLNSYIDPLHVLSGALVSHPISVLGANGHAVCK